MKKILSFLAAGVLALGLIGCSGVISGDLHDALKTDVSVLQIRGDLPGASWDGTDLKKDTEDTYSFSFLATTSTGRFAFTEKDNKWKVAYRGTSDGKLYKGFETSFDEAVLYNAPSLPDCMPVALKPGASYKITVTGGPATVNCKIEQTAEAIPMAIVIDGEKEPIDVTPTGAAKYKYEFEPSNEERTVKFSFKSGISVFAPAEETALTVGNSSSASVSSAAAATWSIKLEKDTPYQLAVSYADGKVSVTFLTNYSCLLANWLVEGWGRSSFEKPEYKWTESLSGITLSAKTYDETTKIATYEARWVVSNASTIGADIALHKGPSDWTGRYELGDNKELKVGTKYKLEKGKDPGNDRAYVLLGEGNNVIVATYESNDTTGNVYVTYSVEKEVIPPTMADLSTWSLKGSMNDGSWSGPFPTFTKIADNMYTAVFKWTRTDSAELEFGLIDANGDWKGGCGVNLSAAAGGTKTQDSNFNGDNSKITDLEVGKSYTLTVTVKDTDGNASFALGSL